MRKKTARIKNWAKLSNALVGIVFCDGPQEALPPGKLHRTSEIVKLIEDKRICETRNTISARCSSSPATRDTLMAETHREANIAPLTPTDPSVSELKSRY
jgi:hypothetical protein